MNCVFHDVAQTMFMYSQMITSWRVEFQAESLLGTVSLPARPESGSADHISILATN